VAVDRISWLGAGALTTKAAVPVWCGLVIVLFALSGSARPSDEADRCQGAVATISGTDGDDRLVGTGRRDIIMGGGGADVIDGRAGNDRICGGTGRDRLTGGGSEGTEPWERLYGGRGTDTVFFTKGGSANVFLRAAGPRRGGFYKAADSGLARLINIENVRGTKHADKLRGDSRANRLRGRKGPDILKGRPGDDVLIGGHGHDDAQGDRGTDTCRTAEQTSSC
jgi:Ca2+-binding RTX toxin-like protein